MKRCPTCQQTYSDGRIRYCRRDGSVLNSIPLQTSSTSSTRRFPATIAATQSVGRHPLSCDHGVCTVTLESNWLDANSELAVCLAQPRPADLAQILNDRSRPESIALAERIFQEEDAQVRLARWFGERAGLLLFPEYAFGSPDFRRLNELIATFPGRAIVCAGFGVVRGDSLQTLLESCQATWRGGPPRVDRLSHYNASWCWIHEGPADTQCYVFLKNFLDQRVEVALAIQLTPGDHILRIVTRDLVLFPLICADLISSLPNGPRARIRQSLPLVNGHPDHNRKVVIATLLYTPQPYHPLWHPAINDIVQLHEGTGALVTVNQLHNAVETSPREDEWRCLSGGFINRAIMTEGPRPVLQPVRYVQTDSASGLVLRQSEIGVSCGSLRWVNSPTQGRYVWVPNIRRFLDGADFVQREESVDLQEFRRYVQRHKSLVVSRYRSAQLLVEPSLDQIIAETQESAICPRLWSKLLTGIESQPIAPNSDGMDELRDVIDPALGVFASIESATSATPLIGELHNGQLLWQDHEILIWNSPTHDSQKMYRLLQSLSLERPREKMLIVVAKGISGYVGRSRVLPSRLSDISISREDKSITEDRVRHIYWCPLQEVENILVDDAKPLNARREEIVYLLEMN
jgi:hypothetical protein